MVEITRPRNEDVRRMNSLSTLYLFGDEDTDGSIRLLPDIIGGQDLELQQRANGVWNQGDFALAPNSTAYGREVKLGADGPYMKATDASESLIGLFPFVTYTDADGSADALTTVHLDAVQENYGFQTDDTGVVTGDPITWLTDWIEERTLVGSITLYPATAASGDVSLTVRRTDASGEIIFYRNYSADNFGTEPVKLETNARTEFTNETPLYWEIEDAGGTLSLRADLFNQIPFIQLDIATVTRKTVTPDEDGGALRLLVFDNDGYAMCDNFGNAVLAEENDVELEPPTAVAGSAVSTDAVTFNSDATTDALQSAPASLYRFTGTGGATLTLADNSKGYASNNNLWQFIIKDEGGDCTDNPLTITPQSGLIDGGASIQLLVDFGSVQIYSDGTNYYSI